MSSFNAFISDYRATLIKIFPQLDINEIYLNFDQNVTSVRSHFGDLSSNIALLIGKEIKKNPLEVAQIITSHLLTYPYIEKIDIIKPGFINIFFKQTFYQEHVKNLLHYDTYKNTITKTTETNKKYNIEFVSANPTGPLHIGHGRNAILGDILGRIFRLKGYNIHSEFYINDAGGQIQKLGNSLFLRYQEQCGISITFDQNGYHGEYIINLAKKLYHTYNDSLLGKEISWFASYAKDVLLSDIKETLHDYQVHFDEWFSENTLHQSGAIQKAIKLLEEKGLIYKTEEDNTLWFKSTHFGDEKDRVLKKSDGLWTYTAADIAYFLDKINRGYTDIIMILGQDHHSFKIRMEAIAKAFNFDITRFHIILYQLVTLKNENEVIKMSKRKGNSISLQDVIDTVGSDVARFFYLHRKADAHLDFDITVALEKNSHNPVFYIQYALVRMKSIINKIEKVIDTKEILPCIQAYTFSEQEKVLLRKINMFNDILNTITKTLEPHLLAYYTIELASCFHTFYMNHTVLADNPSISKVRYGLTLITKHTLEQCAIVLGITIPESM